MKLFAFIILALAFAGCITTTNPDGSTTSTPDTVLINSLAAIAVDVAAAKLGLPPESTTVLKTAAADLAGVAAQSQANLGKTPVAANVAQGAGIPAVGKSVQAQLPAAPITQATVNNIFDAVDAVKKVK